MTPIQKNFSFCLFRLSCSQEDIQTQLNKMYPMLKEYKYCSYLKLKLIGLLNSWLGRLIESEKLEPYVQEAN